MIAILWSLSLTALGVASYRQVAWQAVPGTVVQVVDESIDGSTPVFSYTTTTTTINDDAIVRYKSHHTAHVYRVGEQRTILYAPHSRRACLQQDVTMYMMLGGGGVLVSVLLGAVVFVGWYFDFEPITLQHHSNQQTSSMIEFQQHLAPELV